MAVVEGSFTASCWIVGNALRHDRTYQHSGTQTDTTVVLSAAIGKWPAGTDLHTFLLDCCARVTALESAMHQVGSFTIDWFVTPTFRINAVIFKDSGTRTFTIDALKSHGGQFSADARIAAVRSSSFSAAAYRIDNVC